MTETAAASAQEFRIEHDTMGEVRVPANALYSAQTQRAVENFPISGMTLETAHIAALARIKKAAATTNAELGVLDAELARAIEGAADQVAAGAFDGDFDVALERSAAFCRVVALGQATIATEREVAHPEHAAMLTKKAHQLVRTAEDLEGAAKMWRQGELD